MLPRENRLTEDYDFRKLQRYGRTFRTPYFNFVVNVNKFPEKPSRFAFVVSKRLDKRATVRNRLRRRLCEALQGNLSSLRPGFDGAFYPRALMINKPYEEIVNCLNQLLPKTLLLK